METNDTHQTASPETDVFIRTTEKVLQSPSFDTAASVVFHACQNLLDAQSGYVALLNTNTNFNEIVFLQTGAWNCSIDRSLSMPVCGLCEKAYAAGKPVFENNFIESSWKSLLPYGHIPLHNVLFVPLVLDGRVEGLTGYANKKGSFTEQDARIASAFSSIAALSLRHSRNLDRLSEKNRDLERLYKILEDRIAVRTDELQETKSRLEREIAISSLTSSTLQNSETLYRTMVETVDEGIVLQNASAQILNWNNGAERIFGIPAIHILGRRSIDLEWNTIHEDGSEWRASDHPSIRTLQTGIPFRNLVMGIRREHADIQWLSVNTKPIIAPHADKPFGVVITISDITEQRLIEADMRRMHKLDSIRTLAGGIAHEFNNILGGIIGFTEIATDDARNCLPVEDSLNEIHTLADRARRVVNQILSFSRAARAEKKPVQPHVIVRNELKMLRAMIPSNIIIHHDIDESSGWITGDPAQIQQIIINLCTNAAQAIGHDCGIITICLSSVEIDPTETCKYINLQPGPHLKLTVSDTGAGIDPAIADRVYDPFFTTKDCGSGAGLGLSIVHGIVSDYGGSVTFESIPGKGTAFTLFFPAITCQDIPEAAGKKLTGTERILLVEDEDYLAETIKRMLARLGYTVTALTDSRAALDLYKKAPGEFDLVVTDLVMPHLSGDRLVTEIMKLRPDMKVILMSGCNAVSLNSRLQQVPVKAVIPKPFTKVGLGEAIRRALDETQGKEN